jgi:hypothetical protein
VIGHKQTAEFIHEQD